jgi:uncharacterized protein YegP (UPF0339 family)
MKLTIYQDNGGLYHWALLDGEDHSLARSSHTFATYEDARQAVQDVHDHAGSITIPAQ